MISHPSNLRGSSTPNFSAPTMGSAMDTAFALGAPTDKASAAHVLDTGGAYVSGASGMLARIDEGIRSRVADLDALDGTDPAAAATQRGQIDLLQRLHDRVSLSIERINDLLAGGERSDIGGDAGGIDVSNLGSRASRRAEELALLERRHALLSAPVSFTGIAPDAVAGTYGQGEASGTTT
jgi:hypothetical protein